MAKQASDTTSAEKACWRAVPRAIAQDPICRVLHHGRCFFSTPGRAAEAPSASQPFHRGAS